MHDNVSRNTPEPVSSESQLRPHGWRKLLPIVLLLLVTVMIAVVLWRHLAAMR